MPIATKFGTQFPEPTKFDGYPLDFGVLIDADVSVQLYFERKYLNQNGAVVEIKSTAIPMEYYGGMVRLGINDIYLPCASAIEVRVTDENINQAGVCPPDSVVTIPGGSGNSGGSDLPGGGVAGPGTVTIVDGNGDVIMVAQAGTTVQVQSGFRFNVVRLN